MSDSSQDQDLLKRTIRAVAVLVGSCVLFVGALSVLAVLITSLAVGGGTKEPSSVATPEKTETPATPSKASPGKKSSPGTAPAQPAGNLPI